ncbi:MAG: DUF3168 domain-containing protein [Pseudomonadota bacterium]
MTLSPAWDLQTALWSALTGDAGVLATLGGPHIHDDVPQGADFPFVSIGEIRTNDWSTQSARGHEHFLTLHAWSRARGRKEVQAIMTALDQLLDGAAIPLQDHVLVNLSLVFWDARRDRDGETYHGVMRFRAVTEPATQA